MPDAQLGASDARELPCRKLCRPIAVLGIGGRRGRQVTVSPAILRLRASAHEGCAAQTPRKAHGVQRVADVSLLRKRIVARLCGRPRPCEMKEIVCLAYGLDIEAIEGTHVAVDDGKSPVPRKVRDSRRARPAQGHDIMALRKRHPHQGGAYHARGTCDNDPAHELSDLVKRRSRSSSSNSMLR